MFIAVYEFKVKIGKTEDFRKYWLETTEGIYKEFGSQGSRLHSTIDPQTFVGYAQWPDHETWNSNKEFENNQYVVSREKMRECIESSKTVYKLEVTDDFLQSEIFATSA